MVQPGNDLLYILVWEYDQLSIPEIEYDVMEKMYVALGIRTYLEKNIRKHKKTLANYKIQIFIARPPPFIA